MQELEKILEEIDEATRREDAPIYCGSMEVDGYVRMSVVEGIIRKHVHGKDTNVPTNDDWIPVEERLPEESGYYRVTVKNKELGDITEETAWFAHVDDYDIDESEWREIYEFEEVIAWRELEPYRPERSEVE